MPDTSLKYPTIFKIGEVPNDELCPILPGSEVVLIIHDAVEEEFFVPKKAEFVIFDEDGGWSFRNSRGEYEDRLNEE